MLGALTPVLATPPAQPRADSSSDLAPVALLIALCVVAAWRLLIWLVLVGLVALVVLGCLVLANPKSPGGIEQTAMITAAGPAQPSPTMIGIVSFLVICAAMFVLGLLLGEQHHRRQLTRRERQLADARHEVDHLSRQLQEREARHRSGPKP